MNEIGQGKFAVPQPGQLKRVDNLGSSMPVLGIGESLGLVVGQIERLETLTSDLYQQLSPLLAPASPEASQPYCAAPTDSEIPGVIVGYAGRLRALNECLCELKGRLRL